ncbi:copper ion binding protein [Myxococcota bacterium]|nr:copper ion binding protein [Myxococcota bacterium]
MKPSTPPSIRLAAFAPVLLALLLIAAALPSGLSSLSIASPKPHTPPTHTQQITLDLSGLHCGGCVESITRALQSLPGVQKADVTLEPQRAIVVYTPKQVTPQQMLQAIEKAGYKGVIQTEKTPPKPHTPPQPTSTQKVTLKIAGMSCGGCVARITEALQKTKGVLHTQVTLDPPQAIVSFHSKLTNPSQLAQIIRDAGYRVLP